MNSQTLDGATHGEIAQFIERGGYRELSLLVTSKTRVYADYSRVLRNIRLDTMLPMEYCEKLRARTGRKSMAPPATTNLRHSISVRRCFQRDACVTCRGAG